MSLTEDGRTIICDGPGTNGQGCPNTMRSPVALRQLLRPSELPPADGWLCVTQNQQKQYFCPQCAADYLSTILPTQAVQETEWIPEGH